LNDARERIGRWREHYNSNRPHSALGYLAPAHFAQKWSAALTRTAAPAKLALAMQRRGAADQQPAFFRLALSAGEGRARKNAYHHPASHLGWTITWGQVRTASKFRPL